MAPKHSLINPFPIEMPLYPRIQVSNYLLTEYLQIARHGELLTNMDLEPNKETSHECSDMLELSDFCIRK